MSRNRIESVKGAKILRRLGYHLQPQVTEFSDNEDGLLVSTSSSSGKSTDCSFVILAIGVRPGSLRAKEAGLGLNQREGIKVDEIRNLDTRKTVIINLQTKSEVVTDAR